MDFDVEVLVEVEKDTLLDKVLLPDDDTLVEVEVDKVELGVLVGVLVDFEVDALLEVLMLTDVDELELNEVEVDVLVLALE